MRVAPINANEASSDSADNCVVLELLVVADMDLEITFISGMELIALLHKVVGLEKRSPKTLRDPDDSRYFLKCKNVVFLMGIRSSDNEKLKLKWISQLKKNMQGESFNEYSVYLLKKPSNKPENTPFQREVTRYGNPFQWLPFVLNFLFGATDFVGKRPTVSAMTEDGKTSEQINEVNKMLKALGVPDVQSDEFILLFYDNSIFQSDTARFREAKLNGCFIHACSTDDITNVVSLNDLCYFTTRQSSASKVGVFIFLLLLDIGLIRVHVLDEFRVADKMPAKQIATPIKLERPTLSSVLLRWKELTGHTDKSRTIVKRRSDNSPELSDHIETIDGTSSTYTATDLQQNRKYQFVFVVESYDNISEPTYTEWFSIEEYVDKVRKRLLQTLMFALLIIVIILDVIEFFVYLFTFYLTVCLTIILCICTFLVLTEKIFEFVFVYMDPVEKKGEQLRKEVALGMYIFFFVTYMSTVWMIPVGDYNDERTISFQSPIYIIPPLYLLCWSITANIVCYKLFGWTFGVFGLPFVILNARSFKSAGSKARLHVWNELETILTVRDIE